MRKLLLGSVCVVGLLSGCTDQSNANQETTDQAREINELKKQIEQISLEKDAVEKTLEEERIAFELAINEQVNNDYSMIVAKEIENYPQSLYKKTALDLDGDGEEEVIELYVNAEKMEDGLFAWDDGQNWLLVVKDGEETYPLFDDFVQLGSIRFSTATFDGKPGIVMIMAQHSDKIIQKFTYDKNEKGYQKETFYKKENIHDQYNQPASYAFFNDAYQLMDVAFTTKAVSILEANESALQDFEERRRIIDPILVDIYNAQGLLETVAELNRELTVSLDGAVDLLNSMFRKPPTAEQMNQLRVIHDVFNAIETEYIVNKDENQLHPEVQEKLRRIDFIR
ncbi:hypothetical protein MHZ92_06195 [Sporosarcina sp. ACRSL]|uniref:hypothetical protein n=1 Tax=Sporosarcina sp. ACRSL TaxID=2918215 RepID=UPI001EF69A8B|nr:hypothetical protein [Sporosarcina sp. ACRSL]MCG7343715.1 hypothetical protein [Sporosarcina sp. ACRSL]